MVILDITRQIGGYANFKKLCMMIFKNIIFRKSQILTLEHS